ncbi:lipid phosphate phosphatase 2-like isoform X1 [Prosopis cineraria]|uniref:lipid phosphate phosphatase 2-like isoform X1 n=2 Tax=Prosopis cineraria TaxID=364024 RepID=UPI00240F2036|nr:lipid phosphate phosphatase 2-like isoform X1 [Prosopis cineraria]
MLENQKTWITGKLRQISVRKQKFMMGSYTIKSHGGRVARTHKFDWLVLLILVVIDLFLDSLEPFHRFVGEGMMTDFKYPYKDETIPFRIVQIVAILFPIAFFFMFYIRNRNVYDLHHSILGILFSGLITAVITDLIKVAVGRPRPNFFWRCFPDGKAVFDAITNDVVCHGDEKIIKEGYKSFPSGHTSWAFAGFSFFAWYLSGKIQVFDRRGHIGKLCLVLLPLLLAAFVAVSRVDDYRHHWQDVFAGGLIGITVSSTCYLLLFPLPHQSGWAPHAYFEMLGRTEGSSTEDCLPMLQPQLKSANASSSEDLNVRIELLEADRRFEKGKMG